MAQLKFYKSASAPAAAATGAIWFDTTHHTIQVKTDAGWDKYAGALNDATWDGFNLTITKHDGSSIVLNFSDFASASGVTAALAGKLAIGTAADAAGTQSYHGLKKDIEAAKSELSGQISGKNVSAKGDTLVSASADDNKVTIAATKELSDAVALAKSALQAADKTELQNKIDAIDVVGDNKYINVDTGGTNGDTFTVALSQYAENKLETSKTTVNAKADGHVIVTITPADQFMGDIVTITESDIASAKVLSGVDDRVAAIEAVMGGDDADTAINKVSEIITFLNGIEEGTVAKDTFDAVTAHGTAITNLQNNTVNGKKISENPVLAGSDVLLTGYTEQTAAALDDTDSINVALGKLEARVDAAAAGGVQSVGGEAGSITLRGGQTANGSVNLAMSGKEIQATLVGFDTKEDAGTAAGLIAELDAEVDGTGANGVKVTVTEVDGKITAVAVDDTAVATAIESALAWAEFN